MWIGVSPRCMYRLTQVIRYVHLGQTVRPPGSNDIHSYTSTSLSMDLAVFKSTAKNNQDSMYEPDAFTYCFFA